MTGRTEALLHDLRHCLNFLNKAREEKKRLYANLIISPIVVFGTIYFGILDPNMLAAIFQELGKKYLKQLQKAELEHQRLITERQHLQNIIARYKHNLFTGSIEQSEIDAHYDNLLKAIRDKKNEAYDQWHTSECSWSTSLHLYPYVCHTSECSSLVREQTCRTIFDSYCQHYASIDKLTNEKELRQCQYAFQGHSDRFALDMFITALSNNEQEIKKVNHKKEELFYQQGRNNESLGYALIASLTALILIFLVYTYFYFKTAKNMINSSLTFPFTGETRRWLQRVGSDIDIHQIDQVDEDYFICKLKQRIQDLQYLSEIERVNMNPNGI